MSMNGIKLRGTGHAAPENIVTNDDLARRMDTSDEWIVSRTGIRRRHHCTDETPTQLCVRAARAALQSANVAPEEIGVCIVATMTPESLTPSTACMLQRELGLAHDTACFDLNAACSGFLYGLHTAECLLNASAKKHALVVGGEALSKIVNWNDHGTCILFGDGAGAAVVECCEGWPSINAAIGCDGDDTLLHAAGPGSGRLGTIEMAGKRVFKFAVETVSKCIEQVLERHCATIADVDYFVFHQANARIIDLVAHKHAIPAEKVYKNLEEYGNTSAASIPIALSELQAAGKVHSGSRVLLVGFGGGLTWGGALVEFA